MIIPIITLVLLIICQAHGAMNDPEPIIAEGNLALPVSQQPNAIFGRNNIVDKGDLLGITFFDFLKGSKKRAIEITPSIVYGVTSRFSLFTGLPIAASLKNNGCKSSGVEDFFIQAEYALLDKKLPGEEYVAVLIGSLSLPSGSATLNPPTGFGSPSFFFGLLFNYISVDWYLYASAGVNVTTKRHGFKFGKQAIYQGGIGHNIAYKRDKWILSWMVEFSGLYTEKSIINNQIDPNSGGNVIVVCPSFYFSTQRLILQAGIAAACGQKFFGNQGKDKYIAVATVGWKFN